MNRVNRVRAGTLTIAFERHGRIGGTPVVLMHGFPYDVRSYDAVVPQLVAHDCDVIVPWLRGFGPTRFTEERTPRSGQQAALAADLLALLDVLDIEYAMLAGYDWGGRAACIIAALHPQRVLALVTGNGHNIQNIATAGVPAAPEDERRHWYQYYLHGERGRAGLEKYRREFCRALWAEWSPKWAFDEATFDDTASAFENPDFVAVVVHSYRHRYGLVDGDPALAHLESAIAAYWQSGGRIEVPTITLDGTADGVLTGTGAREHDRYFSPTYEYREVRDAGHNLPQEKPDDFARAIIDLM